MSIKSVIRLAMAAAVAMVAGAAVADQPLKVGVSAGPLAQLLQLTAAAAKKKGLDVKIVEFTDWVTPNAAVFAGDLDANFFQHVTFLGQQNAARGFNLVPVDPAGVIVPVGLFSKKIRSIGEVKEGDKVAIPNEPLNGARALQLLEKAELIKLKPGKGINVTKQDVIENPKKLQIIELDAAQLYRSLDDVTLAFVNLTYLIPAGGDPNSALISDRTPDERFVLRFVSRPETKDDPRLKAFIEVFKSPENKEFVAAKLPAFIPVW